MLIWFVDRKSYRAKNDEERSDNSAQLLVAKHRNGSTDDINLTFIKECTAFYNQAEEETFTMADGYMNTDPYDVGDGF